VSGEDDCDAGLFCFDVDLETNVGECYEMCTGDESEWFCSDACATCTISGSGVLNLCLSQCDPLAPDCDEGDACYPFHDDAFVCTSDVGGESGGIGEPCEFINVCDPGLVCLGKDNLPACDGASGCCSPVCDTSVVDTCDAIMPGTACTPWFGDDASRCANTNVGVCAAPQ
jgi:hypothetical protein